jgi:dipeptidyl aminopeptidase/acylaminoacyl peptidase
VNRLILMSPPALILSHYASTSRVPTSPDETVQPSQDGTRPDGEPLGPQPAASIGPLVGLRRMLLLLLLGALAAGCSTSSLPAAGPTDRQQPFSYEIIDPVEFTSGDIRLVGRLYLPMAEAPVPGVVMVHGSGRRVRDESQRLAIAMAEAGFAVLRYDKRGVGDSEGSYSGVGPANSERVLSLLADDARAGARFLAAQAAVDEARVGLIGNSQAGWIIPIAAADSDAIAFAVLIVGPAVTIGEENYYSRLTGQNPANMTDELIESVSAELADYSGPMGFDPVPSIEAMDIPALWVLGGHDESIPTTETIQILEEIVTEFDKPFDIHVYPRGTHSLADFETGAQFDFMTEVVLPWMLRVVSEL